MFFGFLYLAVFLVLFGGVSKVEVVDATLETGCGSATGTVTSLATVGVNWQLTDLPKEWQVNRWQFGIVTVTGTVTVAGVVSTKIIQSTSISASGINSIIIGGWNPAYPVDFEAKTYTVTANSNACVVGAGTTNAKTYPCLQVGDKGYCKGPCDAVPAAVGNDTDCSRFLTSGSQPIGWEGSKCTGSPDPDVGGPLSAVPGVCLEAPRSSSKLPDTAVATTGAGLLALIDTITNWFFAVFTVLALIFVLLAAFNFVTAGGDEAKVSEARQKLIWAAIGIIVALISKGLVPIVRSIVGG